MSRRARQHHSAGPREPDDLGRLLETEQKLSSLLTAAREKAERIVSDACAEAERDEAAAVDALTRAEASLVEQQAFDQTHELAALREEAELRVDRLEETSEADLARLASAVLDAVLGDRGEAP